MSHEPLLTPKPGPSAPSIQQAADKNWVGHAATTTPTSISPSTSVKEALAKDPRKNPVCPKSLGGNQ